MSAEQVLTLLQSNSAIALGAFGAVFGFLGFLMAWRALARAGRARKEMEDLSKSVAALEAAERRMSLAIGKEASSKAAVAQAAPTKPNPQPDVPAQMPAAKPPRVETLGAGEGKPNLFSTQQGISDLTRYRKKD